MHVIRVYLRMRQVVRIFGYIGNMWMCNFAKCILTACICVNVCAGYQTEPHKDDRVIYLNVNQGFTGLVLEYEKMHDFCNATIDVKSNIDEVNVTFTLKSYQYYIKPRPCWMTLRSTAFGYVRQLFSIHSAHGFGFDNRIEFARRTLLKGEWGEPVTVPIPGIPASFDNETSVTSAETMTYSHEEDFVIKAYSYDGLLHFQFNMKMHPRDNDGRPMVSGVSKRVTRSEVDALLCRQQCWLSWKRTDLDMKRNCGTTLVIRKRSPPVVIHYKLQDYATADCAITVRNYDDPFYRISLEFVEFSDLNGFCIYASNFEEINNGAMFCSGNPPSVNKTYKSLIGTRGFELRVNGSGSAFMSFRIILTTFHTGVCYNATCDNGRCVPSNQLCRGANPCGDETDCRASKSKHVDYLFFFCCVATGLALLIDLGFHYCQNRKATAKEEARNNQTRHDGDEGRVQTESADNHSPPEVDIELTAARALPSAPPHVPEADLPPSYDQVMSAEAKLE